MGTQINLVVLLLSMNFLLALHLTVCWILAVVKLCIVKEGKVTTLQSVLMVISWTIFFFFYNLLKLGNI